MWMRIICANQGAARDLLGMEGLENADVRPKPPPPETPARVEMQVRFRLLIFAAPHSSTVFLFEAMALHGDQNCHWSERGG